MSKSIFYGTILSISISTTLPAQIMAWHGPGILEQETIIQELKEQEKVYEKRKAGHEENADPTPEEKESNNKTRVEAEKGQESNSNKIIGDLTSGPFQTEKLKGPADGKNTNDYIKKTFVPGLINAAMDYKERDADFTSEVNRLLSGLSDKALTNLKNKLPDVADKLGLKGEQRTIFENAAKAWGDSVTQNKNNLASKDPKTKKAAEKAIEGKFSELLRENKEIPKDFKLPGEKDSVSALKSKAYLLERQPMQEELVKARVEKEDVKAGEIRKKMDDLAKKALKDLNRSASKLELDSLQKDLFSEINKPVTTIQEKKETAETATTPNTTVPIDKPTPVTAVAKPKFDPQPTPYDKLLAFAVKDAHPTQKAVEELAATFAGGLGNVATTSIHKQQSEIVGNSAFGKSVRDTSLQQNKTALKQGFTNVQVAKDFKNMTFQSKKDSDRWDKATHYDVKQVDGKETVTANEYTWRTGKSRYVVENGQFYAEYFTNDGKPKYLPVERLAGTTGYGNMVIRPGAEWTD